MTTALLTILREVMAGDRSSTGTEDWLREPFGSVDEFCKE